MENPTADGANTPTRSLRASMHDPLKAKQQSGAGQRVMERALRAAIKQGLSPTSAEFYPDGKLILCFGETKVSTNDVLDAQLAEWRRTNATR